MAGKADLVNSIVDSVGGATTAAAADEDTLGDALHDALAPAGTLADPFAAGPRPGVG
jgi:hypothetical protein